jgi:hypothetical protein
LDEYSVVRRARIHKSESWPPRCTRETVGHPFRNYQCVLTINSSSPPNENFQYSPVDNYLDRTHIRRWFAKVTPEGCFARPENSYYSWSLRRWLLWQGIVGKDWSSRHPGHRCRNSSSHCHFLDLYTQQDFQPVISTELFKLSIL